MDSDSDSDYGPVDSDSHQMILESGLMDSDSDSDSDSGLVDSDSLQDSRVRTHSNTGIYYCPLTVIQILSLNSPLLLAKCSQMCSPDTKMVLIGDFNVDLLNPSHFLFDELADLKGSHNLNQHVSNPTWFGHGKPSLIDHIYTNEILPWAS